MVKPDYAHDPAKAAVAEWMRQQGQTLTSCNYRRSNLRRQEHLASLGLELDGKSVLEVGAGIGDHTTFFIDRGCDVTVTDGREEHVAVMRYRFPNLSVARLDMDAPEGAICTQQFDIIYCYGLLYHLSRPVDAIRFMSQRCKGLVLLETAVSLDTGVSLRRDPEEGSPLTALHGYSCRPSRSWVMQELRREFPYVYATATQPWYRDFPLDWSPRTDDHSMHRSVFVASQNPVESCVLLETLPDQQRRH